jgi:di/tricarboxylate transporter
MDLTLDQAVFFAILSATLVLFVWGRWRYDLVAVAALLLVFLAGEVSAEQVFTGFGNPAVITVAAILVVSRGLLNAGVVDALSRLLTREGSKTTTQVATLTGIVVLCSSFMNNVGAIALLMPVAIWMSRHSGESPSLLLMPLAFGSLLGGLITLIGTPPNIIISYYRAETGRPAFGMFDFTPVGVGVAVIGVLFISLLGWRLTPRREGQSSPEELFEINKYISEVMIPADSQFVGQTMYHLDTAIEKETEATVVDLIRSNSRIPAPPNYEVMQAGDILMVQATPEDLKTLVDVLKLKLAEEKALVKAPMKSEDIHLMEGVIPLGSPLSGRTAASLHLRHNYRINLLAIARHGERLKSQLGQMKFVVGDILLLQGGDESLQAFLKDFDCLPLAERGLRIGHPRKGFTFLAVGVFVAAVLLATINFLPVQISFTAAALIMVLAGLVPPKEIYESIDWPIIVLLGAMFPLGQAMESTGGAQLIAEKFLMASEHFPPFVTIAVLIVGTMLLSNVVNNAAAAVLMAPVAITLANGMAASADPFLMAVAVGASCAFLTPVGHQSNALVMAPGGYHFGDYWRLGLPLSVLVAVVAVPLILYFWPMAQFRPAP